MHFSSFPRVWHFKPSELLVMQISTLVDAQVLIYSFFSVSKCSKCLEKQTHNGQDEMTETSMRLCVCVCVRRRYWNSK